MSKARKIYKYRVPVTPDCFFLSLPHGKILRVAPQDGEPTMWVELQPSWPPENRTFQWFPTGASLPDSVEHVGTLSMGWTVWHLYEHIS